MKKQYRESFGPSSGAALALWRAARQKFKKFTLWWEPVGGHIEMCGRSGGWMLMVGTRVEPLGLNARDAFDAVSLLEAVNE